MYISIEKARRQDTKNRQNSIDDLSLDVQLEWVKTQRIVHELTQKLYNESLELGIAKEVARAILPEGLTPTVLHMNATLRTWIHYYLLRSDNGTQLEHQEIALKIGAILEEEFPIIFKSIH